MEQKFNSFDQQVKDALEGQELSYDDGSWDELSSKLDKIAPAPAAYFTALTAGVAAVAVIFLALLFVLSGNNNETPELAQTITQQADPQTAAGTHAHSADASGAEIFIDHTDSLDENAASQTVPAAEADTQSTVKNSESDASSSSHLASSKRNNTETGETVDGHSAGEHEETPSAASSKTGEIITDTNDIYPSEAGILTEESIIQGTESSNNKTVRTSCTGTTIQFDASKDYGKDAKYLWNFGDGFFSNEAKPSHTFNKSGTFDVSLSVTSPATGQITSNVVQAMIRVLEGPRAHMAVYPTSPNTIEIKNLSSGEDRVEWLINDTPTENAQTAALSFVPAAEQSIRLTALSDIGCADTLHKAVLFREAEAPLTYSADTTFDFSAALGETLRNVYIFDANGEKIDRADDGLWQVPQASAGSEYTYLAVAKGKNSAIVIRGSLVYSK